MSPNRTNPDRKGAEHSFSERLLLRLAVQCAALLANPRRWLLAMWWRLLGKRLRARLLMAPLKGRSRWAYRLWIAQGGDGAVQGNAPSAAEVPIIALVDDGPEAARTRASLESEGIAILAMRDGRLPQWSHLPLAGGAEQWVMVPGPGDVLVPGAGSAYRAAAAQAGPHNAVIYADDDLLDARGRRRDPHFKPDWNSELYRHFDYVTGSALLRLTESDFDDLPEEGWGAVLSARAIARGAASDAEPVHLRRILHHRQSRPKPHRSSSAALLAGGQGDLPSISVIVPTRNRLDLLRTCLEGVERTDYPGPKDVLVIDNGSDDPATLDYLARLDSGAARVLRYPGPFNFAALNNRAVEEAGSELICFLNNDIEVVDPNWLSILARQAMRSDVGAVGACLLYPDGRIQHAGVVTGIGGGAAHAHRLLRPGEEGYFQRHALPQFVSAVTAACLVVTREKFVKVGGFDEENFAVAFNDVDLCLKLNERGWQTLYEPRATLVHHESLSRGFDRDPAGAARFAGELSALKERWGTEVTATNQARAGRSLDPFHHPALSPFSERFVLDV